MTDSFLDKINQELERLETELKDKKRQYEQAQELVKKTDKMINEEVPNLRAKFEQLTKFKAFWSQINPATPTSEPKTRITPTQPDSPQELMERLAVDAKTQSVKKSLFGRKKKEPEPVEPEAQPPKVPDWDLDEFKQ